MKRGRGKEEKKEGKREGGQLTVSVYYRKGGGEKGPAKLDRSIVSRFLYFIARANVLLRGKREEGKKKEKRTGVGSLINEKGKGRAPR